MRHHVATRKFGRTRKVRRNFIRSLVRALVMEGRIVTTQARASELKSVAEKYVTVAKRQDAVTAMRTIVGRMGGQTDVAAKLVKDIAPKYQDRAGGYTRVLKLPPRQSDGAQMAMIEFV